MKWASKPRPLAPFEIIKLGATGTFTHCREGFRGFANYLLGIERSELSFMFENSAIDHDSVHVDRLSLLYEQNRRIPKGRGIQVVRSHQDEIGALAGCQRAHTVGNAQVFCAVECCELQNSSRLNFEHVHRTQMIELQH